jgi:hypothetical protein
MKPTKKQLKEIQEIEKKVSEVCDTKKTIEVTKNDEGVIVNKETGEPHFLKEKKSRDISIHLDFGYNSASLKFQLNKQGFEFSDKFMFKADEIRYDLHSLRKVGILSDKQLWKCFNRLSDKICKKVVAKQLKEGEIAIHKETIIG